MPPIVYNPTTIIYNDKLKTIIREIKSNHPQQISLLGTVFASMRAVNPNTHTYIRDILDEYHDKFDFTTPTKSFKNQDYFALFMCLITDDLDINDCWETVMELMDIEQVDDIRHSIDCTCCCGHFIQELCMLASGPNSCIVGNCCVEKNVIKNPSTNPMLKDKFKQIQKHQRDSRKEYIEKLKVEAEKAEREAEKLKREMETIEFKKQNPTKCTNCKKYCKAEYQFCYTCMSINKGHVKCECGTYYDKKYKKCFKCNNAQSERLQCSQNAN